MAINYLLEFILICLLLKIRKNNTKQNDFEKIVLNPIFCKLYVIVLFYIITLHPELIIWIFLI